MKKESGKIQSNSTKRNSWRLWLGVVTITVLIVGVVSALSKSEPITLKAQDGGKPQVTTNNGDKVAQQGLRNYVTSNESGQTVVVDRQTGQQRPLTPQEAQTLAEGIKQLINNSTDGLVEIHHANGMVSMDLQGRFQNVLLAKREADGTISQSCVDNVDAAAAFFEIDPVLLGSKGSRQQPVSTTPAIR